MDYSLDNDAQKLLTDLQARFAGIAERAQAADEAGGDRLGCFPVVETTSGSDAGTYTTTVRRSGDHCVISGEKARITNATNARPRRRVRSPPRP